MEEEWRDVVGYEGLYSVSSYGNVRSESRVVTFGKTKYIRNSYILKNTVCGNGYIRVSLTVNSFTKSHYVHRLVAMAFIPNPDNKAEVNHKNSNRSCNMLNNLEWATHTENVRHGFSCGNHRGYWNKILGRKHASSKPVVQLDFSGNVLNRFLNRRHASEETGVCGRNITSVCNKKRNHAGGFVWKYI